MHRKGFTLLELLIVIAILAVLATVAVLVINPLEYIKQSRDAKRIGDMEALNKAIGLADFENIFLGGASTTVFVSLLDTASSTCGTLGLPALPAGYQYHCVATSTNLNKVDGTGWIPVNLTALTGKSPLGSLPVDPVNSATNFYAYIPGGSFALSATLESDKYLKQSALKDGGTNPGKIEMGSDLRLLTKSDGLVGYWPFDEGSGTVAYDKSNNGSNGILQNGTTWIGGKVGSALSFNGLNNDVEVPDQESLKYRGGNFTMSVWIYPNTTEVTGGKIVSKPWNGTGQYNYSIGYNAGGTVSFMLGAATTYSVDSVAIIPKNKWSYVTGAIVGNTMTIYIDGVANGVGTNPISSWTPSLGDSALPLAIGTLYPYGTGWAGVTTHAFDGLIDDARIYNRGLSTSEIQAMYNATK